MGSQCISYKMGVKRAPCYRQSGCSTTKDWVGPHPPTSYVKKEVTHISVLVQPTEIKTDPLFSGSLIGPHQSDSFGAPEQRQPLKPEIPQLLKMLSAQYWLTVLQNRSLGEFSPISTATQMTITFPRLAINTFWKTANETWTTASPLFISLFPLLI